MRYFETQTTERIGFDFYCDIANNIVEARKQLGMTQEKLAEKSGITLSRLVRMENVQIRIGLDDLKKLSNALDVTVDWLIDAQIDSQIGECMYLVWEEKMPDFKLYQRGTSKRMAFLLYDKKLKECGVRYSSGRDRFFVQLVGVPVTEKEIQSKFPKRTTEDLPIEPDK
ncbi:MAG: helix-turn-helix transcriptional regulator [Roseburia sp.]|nr:helix-turn-helix transcriptional regulator [Roseburia sp.]